MRSIVLSLGCSLALLATAYGQDSTAITFKFSSSDPSHVDRFITVGVHKDATPCIDKELAERELPPAPPGGLWARLSLPDECLDEFTQFLESHKDLRPLPVDNFVVDYRIIMKAPGNFTLTITWDSDLHHDIDSAILYDNFAAVVDSLNMRRHSSIEVTDDRFFDHLNLRVYFRPGITSLAEHESQSVSFEVFPNPAQEKVFIRNTARPGGLLKLYSMAAVEMLRLELDSEREEIDISHLPAGMYFLRYTGIDGEVSSQTIVKN